MEEAPQVKHKSKVLTFIKWSCVALLLMITLLCSVVYVGGVTQWVVDIVTKQISSSSDLDIKVGEIDIDFPLKVELRNTVIYDKSVNDTMLATAHLSATIKPLALISGKIRTKKLSADTTAFNLFSEDNSMTLRLKASQIELPTMLVKLSKGIVDIEELNINSGDVNITLNEVAEPAEADTTATAAWNVGIKSINLKDFNFNMRMLPTIDNLNMAITDGAIEDMALSTEQQELAIKSIIANHFSVKFYTPSEEFLANYVSPIKAVETQTTTPPWRVTTDMVKISDGSALYTQRDYTPTEGLDPNYIQAERIEMTIQDFLNYGSDINLPITSMQGVERSGLDIRKFNGEFVMNSDGMDMKDFNINTPKSYISLSAHFDNQAFEPTATEDNGINVALKTTLSPTDISKALPDFDEYIQIIPTETPLTASVNLSGAMNSLNINKAELYQQDLYTCSVTGDVQDMMQDSTLNANLEFNGDFINIGFLKDKLLSMEESEMINLPQFTINGSSNITLNDIDAVVTLQTLSGVINANTNINLNSEQYLADVDIKSLPVSQIIPSIAIDSITSSAYVQGRGFDIFSPSATLNSDIIISKLSYDSIPFDSIDTQINIADGVATVQARSLSDICKFNIDLVSTILDNNYEYTFNSRVDALDLLKLKLASETFNSSLTATSTGRVDMNNNIYDVSLLLDSIALKMGNNNLRSRKIRASLYSDSTNTNSTIKGRDLLIKFATNTSIDGLTQSLMDSYEATMRHISEGDFKVDSIHEYLPELSLSMDIEQRSIIQRYLKKEGIKFHRIDFDLNNDTTFTLLGTVSNLVVNGILIDSTAIKSNKGDNALLYSIDMFQTSGKPLTQGSTHISGDITANKISALFSKKKHDDTYSLYIGNVVTLADSTVTLTFFPEHPIIGSELWAVNDSNYIRYNYSRYNQNKAIRANLRLSQGNSYLKFRTFMDSTNTNNINLAIKGIELGEWLNLSPFSPPITGELNAQANLTTRNRSVWGGTHVDITELYYNNTRVGTFATNLLLGLDPVTKTTQAYANLIVNNKKVLKANGVINDTVSRYPATVKLTLDSLPLAVANPFIPADMASVSGYLSGAVDVVGSFDNPSINGNIAGDSVNIHLPMFGSYLRIPDSEMELKDNLLTFRNFNITGSNNKSLKLNGDIMFTSLFSPYIDLQLAGRDVQVINSKQSKSSMVFGKGSIDLTSTIQGKPSKLDVNADLTLLSGSDITYVMQSDVSTVTSTASNDDLVTFTKFNKKNNRGDSIVKEPAFGANVKASLNVNSGVKFNVYLTPNGFNKLSVNGAGRLNYTQDLIGDISLIGRYTIKNGSIKYKPPLIPMVNFAFTEGSYLSWSGDMMNPSISIKGTQPVKTSVAISGEDSRLVDFLIGLNVSNTLSNLDIALDLSTKDNVTIANQLASMSADERATQAMNLLLYGTYTAAEGSGAGSSLYTSPLYSFVEGQVNQWAAQNIKAVDVSIGLNNYDKMVDGNSQQSTDYSYEISKSLLDDRFKITIGGSYNTGTADEEDIALNLINNISFDYQLKKNGNSYVKLFRQNGYESVLEGEVSSMGVGYVYKRKIKSFKQLFNFNKQKKKAERQARKRAKQEQAALLKQQPLSVIKEQKEREE